MQQKVSVIIPFYKNYYYLKKAIRSVLKQTYRNFEIIIINDNLENEKNLPEKIYKEFKYFKKIKIINNKKNFGAGISRNKGIKLSIGKYVAFLDSDDLWHPNKLKKQLGFMVKNDIYISHTSYNIIDKNNRKVGFREAKKLEYKQLLRSCDIGLSTVMIKKSLLKKNFFAKTKTKEDYILWLKLSKKGVIFFALEETLTSWRKLNDSLSSSVIRKLIDGYYVYRVFLKQSIVKSFLSLFILSFNYIKK